MAEYIDREALFAEFDRLGLGEHSIVEKVFSIGVRTIIAGMPAADVAPVVRCKDCKWFADNNGGDWFGCWLFQTIQIIPEDEPKPDDFCSYGELKMDGGDSDAAD